MRVLIVDDDRAFSIILTAKLKAWKPEAMPVFAASIAQAKKQLAECEQFQLAFIDQHLPDGDGTSLYTNTSLANALIVGVSADEAPELNVVNVEAGARIFLQKMQVTGPLFVPLMDAILKRELLQNELVELKLRETKLKSTKTILSTLFHEINNPLGAILGCTYLLKSEGTLSKDQRQAIELIDTSTKRIKTVLEQLEDAADLQEVVKGQEDLYQVPGDAKW